MVDMRIKLGEKISLDNPLMTASGTFGYGNELSDVLDINNYGGIVTKSLSIEPRIGNPPPRIVETHCGMINSIGLANIGVETFLEEKAGFLSDYKGQLIVNIAGRTDDEYFAALKRLTQVDWIQGFEINVSCPNVKEGGIEFGKDPKVLGQLVKELRQLTDKFLMIKLSPNVTDIGIMAEKCQECGADAVAMINTLYGAAIDIYSRKPLINSVIGGLSGPAIKPVAIASVIKASKVIDIPIIGMGGISCGQDVVEFLLAGASAVELGTVHFFNPHAVIEILEFLKKYCDENNISAISDLVGKIDY